MQLHHLAIDVSVTIDIGSAITRINIAYVSYAPAAAAAPEAKKEEKKPEEAAAGLGALFG